MRLHRGSMHRSKDSLRSGSWRTSVSVAVSLFVGISGLRGASALDFVSVGLSGGPENGASQSAALSEDGGVVAFVSDAEQLVAGDTNQVRDVFVRRMPSGPTVRVTVSSSGVQANRASHASGGNPSLSGDGRLVAFYSDANNLVLGDSNGLSDVFVHDTESGATTLVTVAAGGGAANGHSVFPSLSADGRKVAFQSLASNLVAGDTNGSADIFVRDLVTGVTELACGMQGNRGSSTPAISRDGRFVAFVSGATNLVEGDTNGFDDVFVCDLFSGGIERVSVGPQGQGNGSSILPAISANGRVVSFKSLATNLVADDLNGVVDVFARDRVLGVTERISADRSRSNADDFSFPPSISDDGRFVAFGSAATDLIEFDTNHSSDVFVRDRQIGITLLVSRGDDGKQGDLGTPDQPPAISGDGRQVAFASASTNFIAADRNGTQDVFRQLNPFFGPGSCPDGTCPDGEVCVDGFCAVPTVTPTPTNTPPATPTPTMTNTATPTPTFRPCMEDSDCPEGQHCRGGYCRIERPCDPEDPGVDLLACFERETCIGNLCECGGDCNLDGYVLGTEITRSILILAGAKPVGDCTAADIDLDGAVMGNEITLSVINLDQGCLQEGRPLLFAHERTDSVNLSLLTEVDAAARTAAVNVNLAESKDEVASVQLDILYDPTRLAIDDPSSACWKSDRLSDQIIVAAAPNSPEPPAGLSRLRLFVGSIAAPVGSFGDGTVAGCTFRVIGGDAGATSLQPERVNVGDARGNTFRVIADNGSVYVPADPDPDGGKTCAGDCDGDGRVMGNEITQMVRIMVGDAEMAECTRADADRNGSVFVTDITRAVIHMGLGCP